MTTPPLARCTHRGCPIRYRSGGDRPCPEHATATGWATEPGTGAAGSAWMDEHPPIPADGDR